jgi:outer membrane protein OmpA-like peptidoglycan-associated protein
MQPSIRNFSLLAALAAGSACASLNKKESGAIIGATTGAAVGAAVGSANGSTAKGAIIGAAVGGTAGAVIGHQMDQQAKEIQQNIPGAIVERVGEGLQVTFESGLLFDFNSDVLRAEARNNLATFAKSLDKYPGTDILVVGHTDSVGTDAYNAALSGRRAAAAQNYLASQGVATSRLRSAGRGESEPVASNDTEMGRQKNRRVEVAIYANQALKTQALRSGGL